MMSKNDMLCALFTDKTFKEEAQRVTDAAQLQALFAGYGVEMTQEEVVTLCGQIAGQMKTEGELTDEEMDNVTGGAAWALIGLGALCLGAVALGIYNGYQEAKRGK